MIEILLYVLVFYAGGMLGFWFKTFLYSKGDFSGAIIVTKYPDKTLYSLELNDDPEELEARKEVVFKVIVPDDGSQ
jgi:hypothetical protein